MKTVGISEFKAKCIALLKEVDASGEPMTVTLRGRPIVRIEPEPRPQRVLGALQDQTTVNGEIVGFDFDDEWEMNQ